MAAMFSFWIVSVQEHRRKVCYVCAYIILCLVRGFTVEQENGHTSCCFYLVETESFLLRIPLIFNINICFCSAQDEDARVSIGTYWKELGVVLLTCAFMFVYEFCER